MGVEHRVPGNGDRTVHEHVGIRAQLSPTGKTDVPAARLAVPVLIALCENRVGRSVLSWDRGAAFELRRAGCSGGGSRSVGAAEGRGTAVHTRNISTSV